MYTHGLSASNDKYPSTFLPKGFTFCAVTVDGTITLWNVKQGDRLQSVQHLCLSRFVPLWSLVKFNSYFLKLVRPYIPLQYASNLRCFFVSVLYPFCRCMLLRRVAQYSLQQHPVMKSKYGTQLPEVEILPMNHLCVLGLILPFEGMGQCHKYHNNWCCSKVCNDMSLAALIYLYANGGI